MPIRAYKLSQEEARVVSDKGMNAVVRAATRHVLVCCQSLLLYTQQERTSVEPGCLAHVDRLAERETGLGLVRQVHSWPKQRLSLFAQKSITGFRRLCHSLCVPLLSVGLNATGATSHAVTSNYTSPGGGVALSPFGLWQLACRGFPPPDVRQLSEDPSRFFQCFLLPQGAPQLV